MPLCDSNPTSQTKRWRRFAERWKSAERNSRPSAWRSRAVKTDSKPHRRSNRLSNRALRVVTKATLTRGVGVGRAAAKLQASEAEAARATSTAKPGVNDVKLARATATVKVSANEARAAKATATVKVSVSEAKAAKATATVKVSVSEAREGKPRALRLSVPGAKALSLGRVRVNGNAARAAKVLRLRPVARVAVHEGSGRPSGSLPRTKQLSPAGFERV